MKPAALLATLLFVTGSICLPDAAQPPKETRPKKIVLIAGPLDADHPPGTHEYEKSVRLLEHCLATSPNLKGVRVETHFNGWPRDDATLDDADTIVLISTGSDRREQDHPLLLADRLQVIGRQMKRGCGLVTIHWTTFFPNAGAGERVLEWVGGHFDYQSGPPPRRWASAIQHVTTTVRPGTPDHPVCRGVKPFKVREEFYYKIRFRPDDARLKPILLASIPGEAKEQVVAWAVERKDGGRGFGFTGGHYFDNWWVTEFRRLVLNAIVWTARAEVPAGGVESTPPLWAATAKGPDGSMVLVQGKFGKALDARRSPAVLDGDVRLRQPPLTVECWARLFSKGGFNVLVASDTKASGQHWEIYSYAKTGEFSAYLPGVEPSEIRSGHDVCDGNWHHLAMTYDGKRVGLFVHGKRVADQQVRPRPSARPLPGPLTIGMALLDKGRVGCDGLIDEVRVSRTLRRIDAVPTKPLPLDPLTVGLWPFDGEEVEGADPAWTPRPASGDVPAWEKASDKDWTDARLRLMDTGPFFNATMDYPSWQGKVRSYRATAVRVGERGEAAVLFDRNQLRLAAGWTGAFLHHSDRRFGLLNTPTPAGQVQFVSGKGPGWTDGSDAWKKPHPATAPLPRELARYRGLYLHGPRTVLSYSIGPTGVLDSPWAETAEGITALTRTVEVGPAKEPLRMLACEMGAAAAALRDIDGVLLALGQRDGEVTAVTVSGDEKAAKLTCGEKGRVELVVQPRRQTGRWKLFFWHGPEADLRKFVRLVRASAAPPDLSTWTKPGPARWKQPLVTRGVVAPDDAPYVIDTITVPYDNPHRALMFLTGIDFLPSGDIAVCTAHGDVWLVGGVDAKPQKVTWKRFATGLYQPLGLKVVNGVIHVLERGQITRLYDRNGDGEADFYENLADAWHVGGGEHSFDTCLETDPQGRFYFFKTGDGHTPTGGCLLRASPDGAKTETFATGFRHPIGLGVSPDGVVTGADQEGNWMPATRVDQYRQGGFYGDMRTHHRAAPPKIYDGPLCWLPREMDNSAGGQVWVPEGKFGPLSGQLLHLSYGRCKVMLLMRQQVDDVWQAGAADLGLRFLSGVARGRFHPRDGHLYVAGLNGWQTAAVRDGCLQRVRYTGKPAALPVALSVHENGIRLTFAEKLDPKTAVDPGRYRVEQWNYRWSEQYGSKRWSVADPDRQGHDAVTISSVRLLDEGRGVFLHVDGVRPVMQMQISYALTGAAGESVLGTVFNTIHRPAPRFPASGGR